MMRLTPQRILRDVKALVPEDALIFTDVGWNKNGVAQQYDINVPGAINHPSGLATMGFGAGAILGAKLAAPDRVVLTLTGDGGFGAANPCVMATAKEQGIPVIWIVMNNSAFGTIAGLEGLHYTNEKRALPSAPWYGVQDPSGRDGQHHGRRRYVPGRAWESYSPDWAAIARGYGIKARKIASADEFAEALKEALECGEPYLIDAPMENIAVPTPGGSVRQCAGKSGLKSGKPCLSRGDSEREGNGKVTKINRDPVRSPRRTDPRLLSLQQCLCHKRKGKRRPDRNRPASLGCLSRCRSRVSEPCLSPDQRGAILSGEPSDEHDPPYRFRRCHLSQGSR